MGLYEYMMLPEEEQWNNLWQNGTFLTHHIETTKKYSLYALYDFFVEVQLDPSISKIVGKRHFKAGETLDKYAGDIDINNF
ncbi:hypothetical protein [Maribacter luteus]|uniref:hypothetical protein n=1 Tax=Maribacter luteus TaxID=2594478 RepID=UPI00249394C7|nr:hypothetical protein [Maribacter luteus]